MPALWRLAASETKLFFREPLSAFAVLAVPPLLLVVLGAIPSFREPEAGLVGLRVIDLYTPIVIAAAITMAAVTVLPAQFAAYREKGVLRRMRTTPVKPTAMLGGQLLMCTVMSVVTMLLVLAVARLAFDVSLPQKSATYVAVYVLAALGMFAVGLFLAALAPTGKTANATGLVLFFPIMFFAGLWIPRDSMNNVLRTISDFTPMGAGVQALQDAAGGDWPQLLHVAVMLGWTIVAGGLAARYFRWE